MEMKCIAHRHSKQKIYYTQPRTLLNPILDLDKINWLSQLDQNNECVFPNSVMLPTQTSVTYN
jgi:hypothetical protein